MLTGFVGRIKLKVLRTVPGMQMSQYMLVIVVCKGLGLECGQESVVPVLKEFTA